MELALQVMNEISRGLLEFAGEFAQFEYDARLSKTLWHFYVHIFSNIIVDEGRCVVDLSCSETEN
jgi:hypothetical protein